MEEINAMKAVYSPTGKFTLLGQSWGGGLASLYASKHPGNIEQLLLIEPMPLTGRDMQKIYKTIIEFSYDNGSWNNLARFGQAVSPNTHAQIDYRAMLILRSTMTSNYHCDGSNPPDWPVHRVGGFVEYVRNKRMGNPMSGFKYDFTQGLSNYKEKVLILGGSCSSIGYKMQLQYTKPYFPNAEVVEIKDEGHRMNMEKFDDVMTAMKSFLKAYRQ